MAAFDPLRTFEQKRARRLGDMNDRDVTKVEMPANALILTPYENVTGSKNKLG
jgi:hypothetical protein